ncbi:MAG: class I SAM-dependent methyltransferase [Candidatus Nanohaloarchaea archaeon]|nr:class I SAM-dependent methyltransferase [Candidatus Nanohaloarchaea archaeon]
MRDDVKEGYEKGDWPDELGGDRELREYEAAMLEALRERLGEHPSVLDLGCGTGLPYDRWLLQQGCKVTGVDFVEENLEHAREALPDATFIQTDFSTLEPDTVYDAITSFYAVFHIPREEHGKLFNDMREWLQDRGWLLLTIAPGEMDRYEDDFLGGEIVWSQYSPTKTREMLEEAGFEIVKAIEEHREEADEHHIWLLAKAVP